MFLDELAKRIFLLGTIVSKQTNGDLEIAHDVTVSKRLAFEVGKTGVAIRVVR